MSDDKKDSLVSTKIPDIMKPIRQSSLRANRNAAREALRDVDPLTCENRLGLIFDDSSSMSGQPLQDAKDAVRNFTLSCKQINTSLAIYPLNHESKPLTIDYDLINLFVGGLEVAGSTPLYTTLLRMLDSEITRGVIFSDGSPTDNRPPFGSPQLELPGNIIKDDAIAKAKEKKLALDTIFIGYAPSRGYDEMKWIAEQTGGIFIHFKDSKSLTSGLKYLSPGLRGMLMNAEIKARIEKGESI